MYADDFGSSGTFGTLSCAYLAVLSGGRVVQMFMFGSMVIDVMDRAGRRLRCTMFCFWDVGDRG